MLDQIGPSRHEEIAPLRIALLARLGETDQAVGAIAQALATEPPLSRETLLCIAAVSEEYGLGREEACYCWMCTEYGRTADLTYAEACTKQRGGQQREGVALFVSARRDEIVGSPLEWKLAEARYLDRIGDPGAKALWVELVDENPGNITVQWGALAAGSLAGDRAVRDRALGRLKDQIGPEGVAWRMARAKWLLEDAPSEAQIVEAAILASEATHIVTETNCRTLFSLAAWSVLVTVPLQSSSSIIASQMARPISITGQNPMSETAAGRSCASDNKAAGAMKRFVG